MTHTVEQICEALDKLEASLIDEMDRHNEVKEALDSKITRLKNWLWEHAENNAANVTEEYVAIRDQRSALKKQYDLEDEKLKAELHKREVWLMQACDSINAQSIRTDHGTAYIQIKKKFSVGDWPNYWQYMKEHDRFDLVEKRPAQAVLAKMAEEGEEDLPPGLNTFSERTITIRRS